MDFWVSVNCKRSIQCVSMDNKKKELVIREYWENLVSIRSNGFVVKTEIKSYGRVFVVFMVFDYRMV